MITYGSYVKKSDNLTSTAFSVVLADTMIALLAGLVIFPAAFSFGVKPEAGMGLVFNTLPMLFNQMAGGYWFCLIFFVLLAIAALTSTISLLEVLVAYLSEELHLKRQWATVVACSGTMFLGTFASLSLMSGTPFAIGGSPVFDLMDFVSSNILLPVGGVLIVLFVGWKFGKKKFFDDMPKDAFVVTNLDDKNGLVMTQNTKAKVTTYSLRSMSDFKGRLLESGFDGMLMEINGREAFFKFIGKFNASNLLAVYGTAVNLGRDPMEVLTVMSTLVPVNGRFDAIHSPRGPRVFFKIVWPIQYWNQLRLSEPPLTLRFFKTLERRSGNEASE